MKINFRYGGKYIGDPSIKGGAPFTFPTSRQAFEGLLRKLVASSRNNITFQAGAITGLIRCKDEPDRISGVTFRGPDGTEEPIECAMVVGTLYFLASIGSINHLHSRCYGFVTNGSQMATFGRVPPFSEGEGRVQPGNSIHDGLEKHSVSYSRQNTDPFGWQDWEYASRHPRRFDRGKTGVIHRHGGKPAM